MKFIKSVWLPTAILIFICFLMLRFSPVLDLRFTKARDEDINNKILNNSELAVGRYLDLPKQSDFGPNLLLRTVSKNVTLGSLMKGKPTLIYRFKNMDCSTCYESHIELLRDNGFFGFAENTIIMPSNVEPNYLRFFKEKYGLDSAITLGARSSLESDTISEPYFVVIKAGQKSHIYVPGPSLKALKADINSIVKSLR